MVKLIPIVPNEDLTAAVIERQLGAREDLERMVLHIEDCVAEDEMNLDTSSLVL